MPEFITHLTCEESKESGVYLARCVFNRDVFEDSDAAKLSVNMPPNIVSAIAKRRAEYVAGRHCAHRALQQLGFTDPVRVNTGDHREPLWPQGVVGSITHSHRHSASVVGFSEQYFGLGVDIEKRVDAQVVQNIQSRVLTDTDRNCMAHSTVEDCEFFTCMFAVKEAFFKTMFPHVGRYFGFSVVSVVSFPKQLPGIVELELTEELTQKLKQGDRFEAYLEDIDNTDVMALMVIPK